jgi:anti-sigma-K factor RskA
MIDEATQDLATEFVLGELDAFRSARFQQMLDCDEELRRFVRELHEAAADLARSVPARTPPAALLGRILADIRRRPVHPPKVRAVWLPWAIAAAGAIVCIVLALDGARVRRESYALRQRDAFSQVRIASLQAQTDAYAKALAVILWDAEKQRGKLHFNQLGPPAADQDYQLWVIDASEAGPISAGVIAVNAEGIAESEFRPSKAVKAVSQFAVSLEKKGGAVAGPEGPIILAGK